MAGVKRGAILVEHLHERHRRIFIFWLRCIGFFTMTEKMPFGVGFSSMPVEMAATATKASPR